jgi:hypothetical protein
MQFCIVNSNQKIYPNKTKITNEKVNPNHLVTFIRGHNRFILPKRGGPPCGHCERCAETDSIGVRNLISSCPETYIFKTNKEIH